MTGSGVPRVVRELGELREATRSARRQGLVVGFVPTMGYLHEGHLALARVARQRAGFVVVSDFVNPTQFGEGEDLDAYPRDLDADVAKCAAVGVNVVYAPDLASMYAEGSATEVTVGGTLTAGLCSPHRPVHFGGVATIVTKLLGQVGPCVAVFGRKDYQQLQVVKRVVRDLDLEVEVVGVPTVREPDGLALSSRNVYLSPHERGRALALARGLAAAHHLVATKGPTVTAGEVRRVARAPVDEGFDSVDYVDVCDADTLEPLAAESPVGARVLVAGAARLGSTRLIDNVVIGEDPSPLG